MTIGNEIEAIFTFGCNKLLVTKVMIKANGKPTSCFNFQQLVGQEDELSALREVREEKNGNKIIITRDDIQNMGDRRASDYLLGLIERQNIRRNWKIYKND